jgi:hypothetical protein
LETKNVRQILCDSVLFRVNFYFSFLQGTAFVPVRVVSLVFACPFVDFFFLLF